MIRILSTILPQKVWMIVIYDQGENLVKICHFCFAGYLRKTLMCDFWYLLGGSKNVFYITIAGLHKKKNFMSSKTLLQIIHWIYWNQWHSFHQVQIRLPTLALKPRGGTSVTPQERLMSSKTFFKNDLLNLLNSVVFILGKL